MSANVESLMYVSNESNNRFVPWHGLGTPVEEALTSKEAIEVAGLNWNVNPMPIYDQFGNEIKGYSANTRDSDNSVLGIVTNRYQIIQNAQAFEFTDALVGEGMKYETAGSLRNGKQIWLLGRMPDAKVLGEDFENYLCFTNTFDGSGAIRVCETPVRVVCQNTLNLALSEAKRSWSARHIGDINGKLAEAKETLGLAEAYIKALDEEADKLANTKLSDAEIESIVTFMFPIDYIKDSARKINNTQQMRDNFMMCYMMPDIAKYRNTAYGLVNAASDMATHIAPSRHTSNYEDNNWGKVMMGHPLIDGIYNKVSV